MVKNPDYRLYLVTDRAIVCNTHPHLSINTAIEQALRGGVTMVQLREKTLNSKDFFEQALTVKQVCQTYNTPLLINDRVDIALAVDADGVHIGQQDLPADVVRDLIGANKILGVTAKTVDQAQRAEQQGADYLGVGAVFGTTTKADAKAITMEKLRAICQAVTIPVVAIGGITAENVSKLENTGIKGVAVVAGILGQPNIEQASETLHKESDKLS